MCTERKATGEYVLACFMFATMAPVINTLHVLITLARGEPQFRLYSGPSRFVSIFFEEGIPNLVCGCILGWLSVAYNFQVTMALASDLIF